MNLRHHPDAETLLAYSSGNLAEGFALVVATHLALCATCRKLVGRLDVLGGALLDELAPTPMAPDAFARTMATIGEERPAEVARTALVAQDNAQWWHWPPLSEYLDGRSPRWWRPLGPGIGYSPIMRRRGKGASAILLRVAPGAALPRHGHSGAEMNVVLEGGYSDIRGRYEVGDFSAMDIDIRHKPTADPEAACVTLIALAGPLRFGGLPVRLMQAVAGI